MKVEDLHLLWPKDMKDEMITKPPGINDEDVEIYARMLVENVSIC